MRVGFWALLLGLAACSDGSPAVDSGADAAVDGGHSDAALDSGTDAGHDGGSPVRPGYLTLLSSPDDLAALTSSAAPGVKYLVRVPGKPAFEPLVEACYFQDMHLYPWHLQFLRSFPEHVALAYDVYLSLVLNSGSRVMFGGAVEPSLGAIHPVSGLPGVLAFTIYSSANGLRADDVVAAREQLAGCIPFAAELLVYVPESPEQRAMVARERASLLARGVPTLMPEDLRGLSYEPYSRGESYGSLRVVARGATLTDYGPRDIVVVESAPNDISIVAGLLTALPQNALGHVNLRLREKGTPNAAVASIYEAQWIGTLQDHLVHLVVSDDGFSLVPALLEDAEQFWDTHRPTVPPPTADLTVTTLADFQSLRSASRSAYGVKAANLAELRSFLSPPAVNDGFAIPFSRYRDYASAAGLDVALEAFLGDPRRLTDAAFKRTTLDALRRQLRRATFPEAFLREIEARALQTHGPDARTLRLRFRSSTNVEDLDVFTGAGLYESKSGCLADDLDADTVGPSACLGAESRADLEARLAARRVELTAHPDRTWLPAIIADLEGDLADEKPVADAIRKVYASLYSERAFDEREYYGIDHRLAFMGIAVNPSFQIELASSVAVTNLDPDDGLPLYRVNSQAGDVSVVRPEDPLAISELFTFRRKGSEARELRFQTYSSLMPSETPIFDGAPRDALVRLLFTVHDHFATEVYAHLDPVRLDLELKLTSSGDVVVKQVRPYVSRDPGGL
ncbi:MAG: hypothetical protein HYV07_11805 [Deltaproteobacteria bacterium]|nr:hypothetical protein [Deltaproteobacteria bacterium]